MEPYPQAPAAQNQELSPIKNPIQNTGKMKLKEKEKWFLLERAEALEKYATLDWWTHRSQPVAEEIIKKRKQRKTAILFFKMSQKEEEKSSIVVDAI